RGRADGAGPRAAVRRRPPGRVRKGPPALLRPAAPSPWRGSPDRRDGPIGGFLQRGGHHDVEPGGRIVPAGGIRLRARWTGPRLGSRALCRGGPRVRTAGAV